MVDFTFDALNSCSFNVRGLRDITKRKADFIFVRRCNVEVIFLQETHSCINDEKLWKSQWGDQAFFSHGSNHSAGVAILLTKFNGDVIESLASEEGRWIILTVKLNNCFFIICNIYGPNDLT